MWVYLRNPLGQEGGRVTVTGGGGEKVGGTDSTGVSASWKSPISTCNQYSKVGLCTSVMNFDLMSP